MRHQNRFPCLADSLRFLTAIWFGINTLAPVCRSEDDASAGKTPQQPTVIQSSSVIEASGMAFSRLDPTCLWIHNDSGDEAVIYAINATSGKQTARVELAGATAVDWEDMAIFTIEGQSKMLLADVGDNLSQRDSVTLYLLDEPDPRKDANISQTAYDPITIRYPDGPRNCEAVWADATREQIYLAEKATLPWAGVYSLSWSKLSPDSNSPVELRREVSLAVPMITGADHDPHTGELWIINYWQAFRFKRNESETVASQLSVVPTSIPLPRLKQIESVGVDAQSRIWVTSEGPHPPLLAIDQDSPADTPQPRKTKQNARN